jgi:hypothetical protein
LVGADSVVSTPIAGRWIDRRGPDSVNLASVLATLAAAAVLAAGVLGGSAGSCLGVQAYLRLRWTGVCAMLPSSLVT